MGQNLDYYASFSGENKAVFSEDIQTSMEVLQRLKAAADQNKQPKLSAKIETLIRQKTPGI